MHLIKSLYKLLKRQSRYDIIKKLNSSNKKTSGLTINKEKENSKMTQKQLSSFVEVNQIISMDDLIEQTGLTFDEIETIFNGNQKKLGELERKMEHNRLIAQVRS